MKRFFIFTFNWIALLTYSLWAVPLLVFYGSQSVKFIAYRDSFELVKDLGMMIVILTLFPIIFIISTNLYVGFGNNKKILFTASPHTYKRWETFDICLACYLVTAGKIPITHLSEMGFGSMLDTTRNDFKATIQLLLTGKRRSYYT